MHLLADAHIPWLSFLLRPLEADGKLLLSRYETPQELHDMLSTPAGKKPVDALLVRTTAKINRHTFPTFPPGLKCIATATAGTDHVDTAWLSEHGIRFFHSPGCNAQSVGEYVITALLHAYQGSWETLQQKKVGIVGFGNTGQAVGRLLHRLGVRYTAYDPPRAAAEAGQPGGFRSATPEALIACDAITLHTPLVSGGPHPTRHLLSRLGVLHDESRFDVLINASRGGVLHETAAAGLRKRNQLGRLVLDVWEEEPQVRPESLQAADLATPHIAGYSQQAKFEASRLACLALGNALGFEPETGTPPWENAAYINAPKGVYSALLAYHPAFELDTLLRARPGEASFAELRNTFPLRREFAATELRQLPDTSRERSLATALDFSLPA